MNLLNGKSMVATNAELRLPRLVTHDPWHRSRELQQNSKFTLELGLVSWTTGRQLEPVSHLFLFPRGMSKASCLPTEV